MLRYFESCMFVCVMHLIHAISVSKSVADTQNLYDDLFVRRLL